MLWCAILERPFLQLMKIRPRNLNRYGALTALCIWLVVCVADFSGLFRASDHYGYDLVQVVQPPSQQTSDILLVYTPKSYFLEPDCTLLSKLAHQLFVYDARRVGILFDPDQPQFESLNRIPVASKIVVGTRLSSISGSSESSSDNSVVTGIECGFRDLGLEQIIHREHSPLVTYKTQTFPSFEYVIARQLLASRDLPKSTFGINYVGGPEDLPHIRAQEVLDQEIISELVQDKIVLIGPTPDENSGVVTPTTYGTQRMSQLEVHGNILNTILHQNSIHSASAVLSVLWLFLVTVVSCQILRQVSSTLILRSYGYCLLAVLFFSWLGLHVFSIKLPLTAILVATSLAMLTSFHSRFETMKGLFESWNLMRQTGTQADWKAEEKDTWTLIADSVYQIFYPNRMVLMELNSGKTHLTLTKTIQCTPEDIFERRRDVNREPFREAVELGAAMKIRNRQFFVINHETECFEFVAPLILVSELVGFMVLEMTAESVKTWDDFENFLSQFASDMAVLVNKYRVLQQHESRQQNILEKLKEVPEQNRKLSLFQTEVEHHNLENLLSDAFERIQTAAAICDVFGRTIKTNAKMVELLQSNGVVIDNADCISLLESLTAWQKNDCRKLFRHCVVGGRYEQIYLPQVDHQVAPRVLFLEPLSKGDNEREISSRCVCIQVVEGNIFQQSRQWQKDFSRGNLQQAAQRLNELETLTEQLQFELPDKRLAREIANSVSECASMLKMQFSEDPENCVLFDTRTAWESCLARIRPQLEADGIQIVPRFENHSLRAVANPFLLERIFAVILDCVRHDTSEASEIVVTGGCVGTRVVYSFSDVAGGEPLSEFRKSLDVGSKTDSNLDAVEGIAVSVLTPSQIDQFREIESWLKTWDATLSIRCSESYRISVELVLDSELGSQHRIENRNSAVSLQVSNQV